MLPVMLKYTHIREMADIMMPCRIIMQLLACFRGRSQRIICIRITLGIDTCLLLVHSKFFKVVELTRIDYSWIGIGVMVTLRSITDSHIEETMWAVRSRVSVSHRGTRIITVPFD